jgi:hypothetical protein
MTPVRRGNQVDIRSYSVRMMQLEIYETVFHFVGGDVYEV